MIKDFTVIFFFISTLSFSQTLSDKRYYQLDSAVSVMSKSLVKDFHQSHRYLDSVGKTDTEKAWLFYAYIVCHFKYDYDRLKQSSKVSKEYTVEYTSYKTSGVCRDFSKLFTGLCVKSNIACLSVSGKSKISWINIKQKLKYMMQFSNHQWNVIRLNEEWFLVDPTWGSIEKSERIGYIDSKKQKRFVKVKHPTKNYFCSSPEFFIQTHLPLHPAFYCSSQVPKFRKKHRKNWNKKLLYTNYDYNCFLNELWTFKYPYLNSKLITETELYANKAKRSSQLHDFLKNEVEELIGPKAPIYPLNLDEYNKIQKRWSEIDKICKDSLHTNLFTSIQNQYNKEIVKLKKKLDKKAIIDGAAAKNKMNVR